MEYFQLLPVDLLSMFDQTANPIEASGFNLEAGHGLLHQTTAAYMNDLNVVPDLCGSASWTSHDALRIFTSSLYFILLSFLSFLFI